MEQSMRHLLNTATITALALAIPIAALANISGTVILNNEYLNLDTGATGYYVNPDIYWINLGGTNQLISVGGARLFNLPSGFSGPSNFATITLSQLMGYSYTLNTLQSTELGVGDIFAVHTNGGNYAAVMVTAMTSSGSNGTSITLQYTTFFVPASPTITQVLNNYSLIPAEFSNSGIALGSLFLIKGTDLASATTVSASQSSAAPGLPTTLNGATVSLTVDGLQAPSPVFYYAISTQLALVLASNTPTGLGEITVTYNGQTSAPFRFYVVASAFGFDAYYGTGSGLGVATNASNYALYNYGNSIPPGTTVVLYGSGLGADPARDTTYNPAVFPINGLAHIYIGGIDAAIFYQGASGYPGLNEIDVTIPSTVTPGCNVSVLGVSAAGVPTNSITLPIGNGVCDSTLSTLSGQATVNTGSIVLAYEISPASVAPQYSNASGSFQNTSGYGANSGAVSPGGCMVTQPSGGGVATSIGLNTGAITLTGPNGTAAVPSINGSYNQQFPSGFLTTSGGTFKIQAAAGTQVGAFTTQIVLPDPLFTWTNEQNTVTITRSAGWNVTWANAAPGSNVTMAGTSYTADFSAYAYFQCVAPGSAGQFTVPPYVLQALPAGGNGLLYVSNQTLPTTFTATGLDYGFAAGAVNYTVDVVFQ
jgi:uncharacterized protein (TIGR03437 family)